VPDHDNARSQRLVLHAAVNGRYRDRALGQEISAGAGQGN
jgi:hypothetical protein